MNQEKKYLIFNLFILLTNPLLTVHRNSLKIYNKDNALFDKSTL